MYVTDASVWVARLLPEDAHHAATMGWLDDAISRYEILYAPVSLLSEVAGALARRSGRSRIGREALETLQEVPSLRLEPIGHDLALLAGELAADLRVRGADALYLALAVRLTVPLVSWDREQRERGSGAVRTLSPEQASADERRDGE